MLSPAPSFLDQTPVISLLSLWGWLTVKDIVGNHSERNYLRLENAALKRDLKELNETVRKETLPLLTELVLAYQKSSIEKEQHD